MAGIWEITKGDVPEGAARLNVSLLQTELMGVALGLRTRADAKANLEVGLERVLDAAEAADLTAMADEYDLGSPQVKLVYNEKTKFCLNAAELNLIDEADFRTALGI